MTEPSADLPEFSLDDDTASERLSAAVATVIRLVKAGEVERREALSELSDVVQDLSATSPDVTGIVVRDELVRAMDPAFAAAGWQKVDPYEF